METNSLLFLFIAFLLGIAFGLTLAKKICIKLIEKHLKNK